MAIRTGETIEALTQCLIAVVAMSPALNAPSELRKFTEELAKRVRRNVSKVRTDSNFAANFFGTHKEGNA